MLNDRDILNLYSVTKACYEIKNLVEFKEFFSTKLRQVFPHQFAAACIAEAPHHRMLRLINIDFPREYLHGVIRPDQTIQSPITVWLRQQTPLFIKVDEENKSVDPAWLRQAREQNIQNIASHGLLDVGGSFFSYFSFARIHPSVFTKYKEILNYLIPHLHVVLVQRLFYPRVQASNILGSCDSDAQSNLTIFKETCAQHVLTKRESQILTWVCVGKTNWEISRIINISENTVKNHVQNIYKKLGVTNRTQAAGKVALRMQDERGRNHLADEVLIQ